MSAPSPTLGELQAWFLSAIRHPDGIAAGAEAARTAVGLGADDLERLLEPSPTQDARSRLEVYAGAYQLRLIECLGETFPVLRRTIGDDAFESFARAYLGEHPSTSYSLDHLGARFAEHLEATRPRIAPVGAAASWPDFLVDLARLEWGIACVFDGDGSEHCAPLDADELASVRPDANLRFEMTPSLRLFEFRYPVNAHYGAVRACDDDEEASAPTLPTPGAEYLALARRSWVVRRWPLSAEQYRLVRCLAEGGTLGEGLVESFADSAHTDVEIARDLERWFQAWAREGWFLAIA